MLPQPGILLLAWCGMAATVVASPVAPAAADSRPARRVLRVALDLVVVPIVYATILEVVGRADILTGAVLGAAHATIALVLGVRRGASDDRQRRTRRFLARILYGAVFGFLYIVPTP
jgi:hypothetical protein